MANIVFIATSIDGYIADRNNGLEWLNMVPNPDNKDIGFFDFIKSVDAIVMGRNTYETVAGFEGEWPYPIPVFVCSKTLKNIPDNLAGKVSLISGTPLGITQELHNKGFKNLYIDGGKTIQGFLEADLIDEMIISKIPIVLGGGSLLFGELSENLEFELLSTKVVLDQIAVLRYRRKRE